MVSWGRILSGTAIAITLGLGGLAAKPHLEDAWDDHKYELQSEAWAAERQARAEAEEQQYQTDVTRIQTDLDQILSHFHTEEGKNRAVQRLVSAGVLTDATNVEIAEDFLFDKGWYQMGVELLEKNGTDSSDFLARAITQLESKQKYNTAIDLLKRVGKNDQIQGVEKRAATFYAGKKTTDEYGDVKDHFSTAVEWAQKTGDETFIADISREAVEYLLGKEYPNTRNAVDYARNLDVETDEALIRRAITESVESIRYVDWGSREQKNAIELAKGKGLTDLADRLYRTFKAERCGSGWLAQESDVDQCRELQEVMGDEKPSYQVRKIAEATEKIEALMAEAKEKEDPAEKLTLFKEAYKIKAKTDVGITGWDINSDLQELMTAREGFEFYRSLDQEYSAVNFVVDKVTQEDTQLIGRAIRYAKSQKWYDGELKFTRKIAHLEALRGNYDVAIDLLVKVGEKDIGNDNYNKSFHEYDLLVAAEYAGKAQKPELKQALVERHFDVIIATGHYRGSNDFGSFKDIEEARRLGGDKLATRVADEMITYFISKESRGITTHQSGYQLAQLAQDMFGKERAASVHLAFGYFEDATYKAKGTPIEGLVAMDQIAVLETRGRYDSLARFERRHAGETPVIRVGPSTTRYGNRTGFRVNSAARLEVYQLLDSVISEANARQDAAAEITSR